MENQKSQPRANELQVGGNHYQSGRQGKSQHWDMVEDFNLDYFQGQITKYLFRWKSKGGIQDLDKALHYLQKYREIAVQNEQKKMAAKVDRKHRTIESEGSNAFGGADEESGPGFRG